MARQCLEDGDPDELYALQFAERHPEPPMAQDEDADWYRQAEDHDNPFGEYDEE